MKYILAKEELRRSSPNSSTYVFEGYQYGDINSSFFLVDVPPGRGVKLHKHPYEEIFIIQEGQASFTVGTDTIEVGSGHIVIAPSGVPHKFINTGEGRLRQINIHPNKQIITEWLEE